VKGLLSLCPLLRGIQWRRGRRRGARAGFVRLKHERFCFRRNLTPSPAAAERERGARQVCEVLAVTPH